MRARWSVSEVAEPLQRPTPTLPPQTTITDRLRARLSPYTSYIDTNHVTRIQDSGSRPDPTNQHPRRPVSEPRHRPLHSTGPQRPGGLPVRCRGPDQPSRSDRTRLLGSAWAVAKCGAFIAAAVVPARKAYKAIKGLGASRNQRQLSSGRAIRTASWQLREGPERKSLVSTESRTITSEARRCRMIESEEISCSAASSPWPCFVTRT